MPTLFSITVRMAGNVVKMQCNDKFRTEVEF